MFALKDILPFVKYALLTEAWPYKISIAHNVLKTLHYITKTLRRRHGSDV